MKRLIALLLALVFMISFCGCNEAENEGSESSSEASDIASEETPESTEPIRNYVPVSWDDFIKFNGETYIGDWRVTEGPAEMIEEKIGEVTCGPPKTYIDENGNMCDSAASPSARSVDSARRTSSPTTSGRRTVSAPKLTVKVNLHVGRASVILR